MAGAEARSRSQAVRRAGEIAFALWFILSLITPSWRYGPFAWLPLVSYEELAGAPMRVGLANVLPLIVVACTALVRWRGRSRAPWTWGPAALSLPLAGLTVLGTLSLDRSNFRLVFIYVGMYALAWLVYLYVLNERPRLLAPIAAVLLIQGAVAIGQFLAQRDLGLAPLGELPLHPAHEGNSVLWARGQPWLRAYGLTIHPNLLGAMMAALLLLALPAVHRTRGAGRVALVGAIAVGGAGLFLSFSRASWLGFAAGLIVWGVLAWWGRRGSPGAAGEGATHDPCVAPSAVRRTLPEAQAEGATHFGKCDAPGAEGEGATHFRKWGAPRWDAPKVARAASWVLGVALVLVVALAYRDLIFSRFFALDTPTEAKSISERLRDAALALDVIRDRPLTGVGLGEYVDVAQQVDDAAVRVHNAALLVAAELGLPGLLLWLWLMVAPFWLWLRPGGYARRSRAAPGPHLAPWVAMLVVNTFDTTLWLSGNWQTAILFALLAANIVVSGQWPVARLATDH